AARLTGIAFSAGAEQVAVGFLLLVVRGLLLRSRLGTFTRFRGSAGIRVGDLGGDRAFSLACNGRARLGGRLRRRRLGQLRGFLQVDLRRLGGGDRLRIVAFRRLLALAFVRQAEIDQQALVGL